MESSVEQLAKKVRGIIFDVDGVLTSGAIVYGPDGEWKIFNVQDGHGFKLAQRAGLKIGLLTGRASPAVARRAEELGVSVLRQGVKRKAPAVREMLAEMGIERADACYVGDDLVDLPAMYEVGFAVAVANAVEDVKTYAAWTTVRAGGDGAAREVIELILRSNGLWDEVVERYFEGRP